MGGLHIAVGLIMIFIITIVFALGIPINNKIQDALRPNASTDQAREVMDLVELTINYLPYVLIFGVLIYLFASVQRRDYQQEYGGY